jgi:hypothetical protein
MKATAACISGARVEVPVEGGEDGGGAPVSERESPVELKWLYKLTNPPCRTQI